MSVETITKAHVDHRGRTMEQQRAAAEKRLKEAKAVILAALGPINSPTHKLAVELGKINNDPIKPVEPRAYYDPRTALELVASSKDSPAAAILPVQDASGEMVSRQVDGEQIRVIDAIRASKLPHLRLDVLADDDDGIATMAIVTDKLY